MADNYTPDAGELTKLRGQHHSIPMMLIPDPPVVYKASLSTLPAEGETLAQLATSAVSGTVGNCIPDQTILVKDSTEATLKGILRFRKASTTGTLYVGEVSEGAIDWTVGDRLIVIDDFAIAARHLRTPDETTVYMDYEVAYSAQHEHPDPLVVMGGDVVVWLDDDLTPQDVTLDASESFIFIDTISAYQWAIDTLSIADDTTATPTITVDDTGDYRFECEETTSGGASFTGYRHIYARNNDDPANDTFVLGDSITATPDGSGGYKVKMYDGASLSTVRDRAKVILFSRDFYAGVEGSIGPHESRENIDFTGWIVGETIERDWTSGLVTFDIKGADYWTQNVPMFPVGLEDTDFADNGGGYPNRWTEMIDLNLDRALWHLVRWRSTISRMMDVFLTGDTKQAATIESLQTNLWGQLIDMSAATLLARPTVDRYGRLWVRRNQRYATLTERNAITTVITFTDDDHTQVTIDRRDLPDFAKVEASGVLYAGGDGVPMGAISPGDVPTEGKQIAQHSYLIMGTQAEAIELAGLVAGSGAGEFERIAVTTSQNNRFFEVGPWLWGKMSLSATDNERGASFTNLRMIPETITRAYDDDTGAWTTTIEFAPEGPQWGAVAMKFPGENSPPEEGPTEPPTPPIPPEETEPPSTGDAIISNAGASGDVRISADFDQASPQWDTTIPTDTDRVDASLAPWSNDVYVYCTETTIVKTDNATDVGSATWETVYDADTDFALGSNFKFKQIKCTNTEGVIYATATALKDGDSDYTIFFVRSNNGGVTWNAIDTGAANTPKDYTVTMTSGASALYLGYYVTQQPHKRYDDATLAPWGIAWKNISGAGTAQFTAYAGTTTQIHTTGGSNYVSGSMARIMRNDGLSVGEIATLDGWFTEYFGTEGVDWEEWISGGLGTMPNEEERILIGVLSDASRLIQTFAFWNETDSGSAVFDFAPTNNDWVYLGTETELYKSTDGGFTWALLSASYGADDIKADPVDPGIIYFWATDGTFNCMVAGQVQATPTLASVRYRQHTRIAKQINGGKVWTIDGEATLKEHSLGSWADRVTGVPNGCSLRAYLGSPVYLVYLDTGKVWYSANGTSFSDKTGDWSDFSLPISIHLFK